VQTLTETLLAQGWARAAKAALALLFLGLGCWQFGSGLYIAAKAEVAQILLERAWVKTLESGAEQKPWGWADTWPVAKITVPGLGESAIVLDKVSGQALAFGPGLMPNRPEPGAPGVAIIAAHKDTHFSFLKRLKAGQELVVETRKAGHLLFRVTGFEVVDTRKGLVIQNSPTPHLILSTCYPFDALISNTPYRYLVYAELVLN